MAEETSAKVDNALRWWSHYYKHRNLLAGRKPEERKTLEQGVLKHIAGISDYAAGPDGARIRQVRADMLGPNGKFEASNSSFVCKAYVAAGFPVEDLIAQFRARLQLTRGETNPAYKQAELTLRGLERDVYEFELAYGKRPRPFGYKPNANPKLTQAGYENAKRQILALQRQVKEFENQGYRHSYSGYSLSYQVREHTLRQLEVMGKHSIPLLLDVREWDDYPLFERVDGRVIVPKRQKLDPVAGARQMKQIRDYIDGRLRALGHAPPVAPETRRRLNVYGGVREEMLRELQKNRRGQ